MTQVDERALQGAANGQAVTRRTFAAGALALAAAPGGARAQAPGKTYRIAVWNIARPLDEMAERGVPTYRAFFAELRRLGFVEGQNLTVDRYATLGRSETYGPTAKAIVASAPDAIVPNGAVGASLVHDLTKQIPIVVPIVGDPVAQGLALSLARPGGNVTGFTQDGGIEINGLRLQLLREAVPGATRLAYLTTSTAYVDAYARAMNQAADALRVELIAVPMPGPFDEAGYRAAFAEMSRRRADGILVHGTAEHGVNRQLIIGLAAAARLTALYWYREDAEAGGLMSYGVNQVDNYRKAAGYVARVLNGEKPSDLPIQQPTAFDFVVNLKAAKALGIVLPEPILIRATEVIE